MRGVSKGVGSHPPQVAFLRLPVASVEPLDPLLKPPSPGDCETHEVVGPDPGHVCSSCFGNGKGALSQLARSRYVHVARAETGEPVVRCGLGCIWTVVLCNAARP